MQGSLSVSPPLSVPPYAISGHLEGVTLAAYCRPRRVDVRNLVRATSSGRALLIHALLSAESPISTSVRFDDVLQADRWRNLLLATSFGAASCAIIPNFHCGAN